MASHHLLLVEQLFLLSVKDQDTRLGLSSFHLRAAAIADLAIQGHVSVEEELQSASSRVHTISSKVPDNFYMTDMFDSIQSHPDWSISDHILNSTKGSSKHGRKQLREELSRKKIVRKKPKKHWWSRRRYVVLNQEVKRQIQARLSAVYAGKEEGDTKSLTLLALVEGFCGVKQFLGDEWWSSGRKRVERLCSKDTIAKVILAGVKDAERRQSAISTAATIALTNNSFAFPAGGGGACDATCVCDSGGGTC